MPSPGSGQTLDENFLLQPGQYENLYPYVDKEVLNERIRQLINDGSVSYDWVNTLIASLSQGAEQEEIPLRLVQRNRGRSQEADSRFLSDSKLRDQFIRAGALPRIPGTQSMSSKKSADVSKAYKLDSTRNGSFDPHIGGWLDDRVYGSVYNDTGRVVAGYTIDQVDDEGTRDTVYKYYYLFGEDSYPSERVNFQWSSDLMQLLPYTRILMEYFEPDSREEITYFYDLVQEDWILSQRRVYLYEGGLPGLERGDGCVAGAAGNTLLYI